MRGEGVGLQSFSPCLKRVCSGLSLCACLFGQACAYSCEGVHLVQWCELHWLTLHTHVHTHAWDFDSSGTDTCGIIFTTTNIIFIFFKAKTLVEALTNRSEWGQSKIVLLFLYIYIFWIFIFFTYNFYFALIDFYFSFSFCNFST